MTQRVRVHEEAQLPYLSKYLIQTTNSVKALSRELPLQAEARCEAVHDAPLPAVAEQTQSAEPQGRGLSVPAAPCSPLHAARVDKSLPISLAVIPGSTQGQSAIDSKVKIASGTPAQPSVQAAIPQIQELSHDAPVTSAVQTSQEGYELS